MLVKGLCELQVDWYVNGCCDGKCCYDYVDICGVVFGWYDVVYDGQVERIGNVVKCFIYGMCDEQGMGVGCEIVE